MNKTIIIAVAALLTGTAASAQTNGSNVNKTTLTPKDSVLERARFENPTSVDPNSMKTPPGVEMQMNNNTRREQREFKNTVDTPGHRQKLPRRDSM